MDDYTLEEENKLWGTNRIPFRKYNMQASVSLQYLCSRRQAAGIPSKVGEVDGSSVESLLFAGGSEAVNVGERVPGMCIGLTNGLRVKTGLRIHGDGSGFASIAD